jgi:Protein kinase domain
VTVVGEYELEHQLGAGASGTVWRAYRRGPVPRVVALKRLRTGSGEVDLARIRREASVLTELDHPHIVRVLEVVDDGDGIAVAMQFAPGGSLGGLLAERSRLAPGELVAVAAPIAEALASAHRRGIVHGDVKPANVLFTSDGEPLLSDFGVARTLGRVTSDQVTGTAEYLAPELMEGEAPDAVSDVYSLGVVCYEALTGRPPYTGALPLAVMRAADLGEHASLVDRPDVPGPLAEVVERAMARRPDDRFATADELARALRGSLPHDQVRLPGTASAAPGGAGDGDGGVARGTSTYGPRPPRKEPTSVATRFRVPIVLVVGLVAALAIFLVRGPLRSDDEDCPEVEPPVAGPGGQVVEGDPEGEGCTTFGVYQVQTLADGTEVMVLTIRIGGDQQRIAIGQPGEQVLLGDWDCDGVDTPALYRAAAGQVQYFNVWPEVEQQQYQPDRVEPAAAGGTASVERGTGDGDDCDRVVVAAG